MRKLGFLLFVLLFSSGIQAQATIDGYWQDIAGRTTFKKDAASSSTYGNWYERALDVTYPQAKLIRRSAAGVELLDLNYDEKEYSVRVVSADAARIVFVRKASWSACRVEHDCRLEAEGMLCRMQTVCQEKGADVLDWKGEERYVRRAHCERVGRVEAQGIPVKCR
jgi:hypothetical protein